MIKEVIKLPPALSTFELPPVPNFGAGGNFITKWNFDAKNFGAVVTLFPGRQVVFGAGRNFVT